MGFRWPIDPNDIPSPAILVAPGRPLGTWSWPLARSGQRVQDPSVVPHVSAVPTVLSVAVHTADFLTWTESESPMNIGL